MYWRIFLLPTLLAGLCNGAGPPLRGISGDVAVPVLPLATLLAMPPWASLVDTHIERPSSWSKATPTTRATVVKGANPPPGSVNSSLNMDPLELKGRYLEDRIALEHLFYDTTNGLMVEVGANDGSLFSASYFFEKKMGWRTVLVEGDPVIASQSPWLRPNALSVNLIVCDEFKEIHFSSMGAMGGIVETMSDQFAKDWHPSIAAGGKITSANLLKEKIPVVQCVPLGWVLDQLELKNIDFMTVDLLGGELAALKSINFKEITPSVIAIATSARYFIPNHKESVVELLKPFGYSEWDPKSAPSPISWNPYDPRPSAITWMIHESFSPSNLMAQESKQV